LEDKTKELFSKPIEEGFLKLSLSPRFVILKGKPTGLFTQTGEHLPCLHPPYVAFLQRQELFQARTLALRFRSVYELFRGPWSQQDNVTTISRL